MYKIRRVWLLLCAIPLFVPKPLRCQEADSLLKSLINEHTDTARLVVLFKVADYYRDIACDQAQCEKYLNDAKEVAEATKNAGLVAYTYDQIGVAYRKCGLFSEALKFHNDALGMSKRLGDSSQMATSLNNIGTMYRRVDNYALAAENHMEALRIAEASGDQHNKSVACNGLGNVFNANGRYEEAIEYFNQALNIATENNNKNNMAMNYNNIGEIYEKNHDYKTCLRLYNRALQINREIKNNAGIALNYNNIGSVAMLQGDNQTAYRYFKAAIEIDSSSDNKRVLAASYNNMARACLALKRLDEMRKYINKNIALANKIHSLQHLQSGYKNLSDYFMAQKNYQKAYEYMVMANAFKDSMLNERNSNKITALQALYDSERKEHQIKKQQQDLEIKDLLIEKSFRRNIMVSIAATLLIMGIASIWVVWHKTRKRKALLTYQMHEIAEKNIALAKQKEEIISQKRTIEMRSEDLNKSYNIIENYALNITNSIRYAKKIQVSVQPSLPTVLSYFTDSVIFSRPKNIVSGDFFWLEPTGRKVIFALADCTGHGIPAAFMSLIGIHILSTAVRHQKFTTPNEILKYIDTQLLKRLGSKSLTPIQKDGIDIALGVLDLDTRQLQYGGTLIPLTVVRNNKAIVLKPDVYVLGFTSQNQPTKFTTQTIQLQADDWLYLSSDGYYDQIGGPKGRKYQRSRFQNLVTTLCQFDGVEQRQRFTDDFDNWKGSGEQIDDVLVWGLKI